ncbi:unnamed protein product, partial [Rotaria magnacalcarata]
IRYLLLGLFTISISARIIPLENVANEPLTIDIISTNNMPIVPAMSTMDQAIQVPISPKLFRKSICYPVVGCYDNKEPYNNAALEIPQSPEHIDTHFLLFTQETPTTPEFLFYDGNDQSIRESSVNSSRWLRIIVHGFVNNRSSIWIKPLQDELLKLKDNEFSDVLVVDWGNGAKFPFYPNAASNTRLVGKQIGLLLQKLNNIKGLSYDKVHCIAAFEQTSCSHSRSHGYFTESINSECPYNAFPCHDYESFVNGKCVQCSTSGCAQMGFHSIYSLGRGNMYLTTKSSSPFCGHHYLIELVLDRDMSATHGEILVSIHSNYEMLTNASMTLKSDADIKPGDVFHHVFSFNTNFDKVDYAIVHFNKAKTFLGIGSEKGHEIIVSSLRLKSIEDSAMYV